MKILLRSMIIGCLLIALGAGCAANSENSPPDAQNEENEVTDPPVESQDETENNTESERGEDSKQPQPEVTAENEAFRIFEPIENAIIKDKLVVKGEARVFEGTVSYYLEDGHNILAQGVTQASLGAPEWGNFEIETEIDQPTSPSGILMLYEESAKDGSQLHTLIIPVKFEMP